MSYISDNILSLFKQLHPKGRAWNIPPATNIESFQKAFGGDGTNQTGTAERAWNDMVSLKNSLLPDSANFTDGTVSPMDNDCDDWERRLYMIRWGITSSITPTRLQRMAAIATKMGYPGTDQPRQSAGYLQAMLQAYGFNVYVYENLSNLSPAEILGEPAGPSVFGAVISGEEVYGGTWAEEDITVIANSVNPAIDALFDIPAGNYHGIFIIAGATITTFANVAAIQQTQFRQIVLQLKPAHMAGFTFIHFT